MTRGRIITALVVLLAIGGVVWALTRRSKSKDPRYETVKIERGRLVAKVTATGTLSAVVTVLVGSQVSGRIAYIGVDFNTPVKKGQVIARIDRQLYAAAAEQAKANLLAAQGNLAKSEAMAEDARRQAERASKLADEKLIAPSERDTAVANAKAAEAQIIASKGSVEQARAALHQAEINLDLTTITSPVSGVVISRSIDVGQTVAASLAAPTLFTIAEDLAKMQVDTSVTEADVGKIIPGMEVSFTVDAYPGERFVGKLRQVRNAPTTVQNVVTYDAVLDVVNPPAPSGGFKLRPGMTANVTFIVAEKDDVLKVANTALRFRPPPELLKKDGKSKREGARPPTDASKRTVWTVGAEGPEPHDIKIGLTDGSVTEIDAATDLAVGTALITEVQGAPSGDKPSQSMRRPF